MLRLLLGTLFRLARIHDFEKREQERLDIFANDGRDDMHGLSRNFLDVPNLFRKVFLADGVHLVQRNDFRLRSQPLVIGGQFTADCLVRSRDIFFGGVDQME